MGLSLLRSAGKKKSIRDVREKKEKMSHSYTIGYLLYCTSLILALTLCSSDSIDLHSAHNLHRANPFHDACSHDHLEIVKFLAPIVDIELENKFGSTALLLACLEEHSRIVSVLLQQKVKVDTQSTVGMPPMHAACNQ